jgi:hypothetical protein
VRRNSSGSEHALLARIAATIGRSNDAISHIYISGPTGVMSTHGA